MLTLGVNIDHVATLRQARYRLMPQAHNVEPDPVALAREAEEAGALGITAHLRADRRHIQDDDIVRLRKEIRTKLNLELGNTPEILRIVLAVRPEDACLVPEERQEVTTEGGLDVAGQEESLKPTVLSLRNGGTRVSMFIDPEPPQVEASARLGAEAVELHTGTFANALGEDRAAEVQRLIEAAQCANALGLQVNAGHGLSLANLRDLFSVPYLSELNIGHSIISRAVRVGMKAAVREILDICSDYQKP